MGGGGLKTITECEIERQRGCGKGGKFLFVAVFNVIAKFFFFKKKGRLLSCVQRLTFLFLFVRVYLSRYILPSSNVRYCLLLPIPVNILFSYIYKWNAIQCVLGTFFFAQVSICHLYSVCMELVSTSSSCCDVQFTCTYVRTACILYVV